MDSRVADAHHEDVIGGADRPMNRTALLLGDLDDQSEPLVSRGVGVREGNAQRAVVDVPLVEMFDEGALVRRAKLG
jgi:hypothetical protein